MNILTMILRPRIPRIEDITFWFEKYIIKKFYMYKIWLISLLEQSKLLLACQSYKETSSAHTDWLLDLYASNINTLQSFQMFLRNFLRN